MIVSFCDGLVASAITVLAGGRGGLLCKILPRVKCSQNSGYRNHEDAVPTDLLMNAPFFWDTMVFQCISLFAIPKFVKVKSCQLHSHGF